MLVTVLTEESKMLITKNVYFNEEDRTEYESKFQKMKSDGIFRDDIEFNDDIWIVRPNDIEVKLNMEIDEITLRKALNSSEIQIKPKEFILGVKAYVLHAVAYTAPSSLNQDIRCLYKIIKNIGFFKEENIGKFKESLKNKSSVLHTGAAISILDFIGIAVPEKFSDIWYRKLGELDVKSEIRKLPNFKSIFAFGEIVKDFIVNATEEEFLKYGSILLWWQICNRIPLRPTEFVLIPKKCVYKHEGKYYLSLKRNIGKGVNKKIVSNYSVMDTYADDTVRIDEDLFNLVNYYNKVVDKKYLNNKSEYLIDKRTYNEVFKQIHQTEINIEKFTSTNLRNILNSFYEEVVCGKYQKKVCTRIQKSEDQKIKKISERQYQDHIETLLPYDLRHVAIINLIMLGAEPLTVMELAGHKKMKTTMGYYDHTEEYSKSYIMTYAKHLKELKYKRVDSLSKDKSVKLDEIVKEEHLNSALLTWRSLENEELEKVEYKKVDGGICKYLKKDLAPCYAVEGNHSKCPYFVPGNDVDIEKEFYKQNQNINSVLETIKYLVENYNTITDFSKKYSVAIESFRDELSNASMIASNLNSDVVEEILNEN